MTQRRRGSSRGGRDVAAEKIATAPAPASTRAGAGTSSAANDRAARAVRLALAILLLGTSLLVDPSARAAFDAPKRLIAIVCIAIAAAALVAAPAARAAARRGAPRWRALGRWQRIAIALAGAALALAALSALLSPRPGLARQGWMAIAWWALLVPIGASRALEGGGFRLPLVALLAASVLNAGASALERLGGVPLFAIEAVAGRATTGGLVGNEGSLALTLALAATLALAVALGARTRATRLAAAGALAANLAGLVLNPTLTALLAALGGAIAVIALRGGGRALGAATVALLIAGGVAALTPPLAARLGEARQQIARGDWDALLTHRFAPWTAAIEMARARPLLGMGPGTFGAEFVPHRLRAEMRHGRRFLVPRETSSYGEAHSEPLQAAAELGLPAALALGLAIAAVALGLARRLREGGGAARDEEIALLALLVAGGVASLTWFPLQQATSAPVLLIALGRAWRLAGDASGGDESTPGARVGDAARGATAGDAAGARVPFAPLASDGLRRALRWSLALGLIALALATELPRHRAERDLAVAVSAVDAVLAGNLPAGERERALAVAAGAAGAAAAALPYDSRPLLAAAAGDLAARRPERALPTYARALGLGERAEIDLNAGRAFALQDRRAEALAAFVRTAWLSPALVPALPAAAQPLATAEVARLEADLLAGRLAAPPALPPLASEAAPATATAGERDR